MREFVAYKKNTKRGFIIIKISFTSNVGYVSITLYGRNQSKFLFKKEKKKLNKFDI